MQTKQPALWVAYIAHTNNGLQMANDGFFDGQLPVTVAMLTQIRSEITATMQANLDKMKPVDRQGKIVMGAPKPQIHMVQILSIVAAEQVTEQTVN